MNRGQPTLKEWNAKRQLMSQACVVGRRAAGGAQPAPQSARASPKTKKQPATAQRRGCQVASVARQSGNVQRQGARKKCKTTHENAAARNTVGRVSRAGARPVVCPQNHAARPLPTLVARTWRSGSAGLSFFLVAPCLGCFHGPSVGGGGVALRAPPSLPSRRWEEKKGKNTADSPSSLGRCVALFFVS